MKRLKDIPDDTDENSRLQRINGEFVRVRLPDREQSTLVGFRETEDGGTITIVGRKQQLAGEWELTSSGVELFKVLTSGQLHAITGHFQNQIIALVQPLADNVDKQEDEQSTDEQTQCISQ